MSQFYKQIRVVLKTNKQTEWKLAPTGRERIWVLGAGFVPAFRRDGVEAARDGPRSSSRG